MCIRDRLDAVSHVMGRELAEGRQVHLDGIGYFRVSLTTIEPVVAATKRKLTKVKMAGVKFRADQKLKNEIGTIKAKALKANEHSAKLTDKEIEDVYKRQHAAIPSGRVLIRSTSRGFAIGRYAGYASRWWGCRGRKLR